MNKLFPSTVWGVVVVIFIMLLILYQMKHTGSFNNSLPIISLYAFAGYRLLPALQQIYGSFSRFLFI